MRRSPALVLSLLAGATLILLAGPAASAAVPGLALKRVVKADQPTVVTSAPGQPRLLYVGERRGKVRIVRKGKLARRAFLDLSGRVASTYIEQGLLGLAFAPDYRKSRRFYVHYTNRAGDIMIVEYRRSRRRPLRANPYSRRVLLRIPEVVTGGGHNGGTLRFLGNQLYISVGDGNNPGDAANNAQNLDSLRGKILRINPRPDWTAGRSFRIPAGNPLVGLPGRDEIFAWGLRNPHTFSFHQPSSGPLQMVIADVGQGRFEEINYVPWSTARGGNFGWKFYEGFSPYDCGPDLCPNGAPLPGTLPPLVTPALAYPHSEGCAVIGGPVVTDPGLPSLAGRIVYGDFCTGRLRSAAPASPVTDDRPLGIPMPPGQGRHPALNGFGTDARGRVYLFSNFGPVYRLIEKPAGRTK